MRRRAATGGLVRARIKENTLVDCPLHEVMYYAERYFSVHRRGQQPGVFTLSIDSTSLKIPGHVEARHDVKVAYELKGDPGHPDAISLAWDPQDKIMPKFAGVLHAERREAAHVMLILEGEYTPPFGIVGAAFDAVLGQRIASATAAALLQDIKTFIESTYGDARQTTLASSPKD